MKKAKKILKNLAIAAAVIVGIIYFSNQDAETRMFITLVGIIWYLFYATNKRLEELTKKTYYSCTFRKEIIAADSDKVLAHFEITYKLPFPPYIGLEVADNLNPLPDTDDYYDEDNHDFQEFYTGKITEVLLRYSRFYCKVEPHKMTPENELVEVIVAYCDYAWKLEGLYFEERRAVRKYLDEELAKLKNTQDEHEKNMYMRLERVKKKLER